MSAISDAVSELERITGLRVVVKVVLDGRAHFAVDGFGDDDLQNRLISVWHRYLDVAVDRFLRSNLARIRLDLMEEQNGRCAICKRAVPLQLHHKVFRSERRDDRRENLHLLCGACHLGQHGAKPR